MKIPILDVIEVLWRRGHRLVICLDATSGSDFKLGDEMVDEAGRLFRVRGICHYHDTDPATFDSRRNKLDVTVSTNGDNTHWPTGFLERYPI